MSFLDIDENLLKVAELAELVYSPLVDIKEYPENVDVALVEGAVSNKDDLERILMVRERTSIVVSLGDCAVTGNVPAMRNLFPMGPIMDRAYKENTARPLGHAPNSVIPPLLDRVRPVHEVINVDVFVPGCPPPADVILATVQALLEGKAPQEAVTSRFGM